MTFDGGLTDGNVTGTQTTDDDNNDPAIAEVDFSTAFDLTDGSDYGADGAGSASTLSYSLALADGVTNALDADGNILTSGGNNITLAASGNVITGTAGGVTAFTIEVAPATGVITLTQSLALDHNTSSSSNFPDDVLVLGDGLITLTATASATTDSDGDSSATATADLDLGGNIKFGDDGPVFTSTYSTNSSDPINITTPNTTGSPLQYTSYNLVDWLYGADLDGEVTLINNGTTTAVISTQDAAAGTLTVELQDSQGNVVGDIEFDQSGNETINIYGRQTSTDDLDLSTVPPGNYASGVTISTDFAEVVITADSGSSSVNVSTNGLASSNQNFNPGESLTFTFETSLGVATTVNDFTFGSTKQKAGNYDVTVTYSDSTTDTFNTGLIANGATWSLTDDSSYNSSLGIYDVTVEVISSTGQALNIGNIALNKTIDPGDINYDFSLQFNDGDEDTTNALDFNILLSGSTTTSPTVTPVIIDLNGNGIEYSSIGESILTPYFGQDLTPISWVSKDDGIVVYDQDSSGGVTDSTEFVLTNWGEDGSVETDLEALSSYFDSNKDGVFDASDETYNQFGIWQDSNQDGIQQDGEFSKLAELGIKSIGVTYLNESKAYTAADGDVQVYGQSEVVFTDGSTTIADDAAFSILKNPDLDENTLENSSASQQEIDNENTLSLTDMVDMILDEQPITEAEITEIQKELEVSEIISFENQNQASSNEAENYGNVDIGADEADIDSYLDTDIESDNGSFDLVEPEGMIDDSSALFNA